MLRRLLLLFCAACLVVGVGAVVGGQAQVINGCGPTPTPSPSGTPSQSPSPSPCPSSSASPADTTAPTCKVTAIIAGPPKQQQVTVQDNGSGLLTISNVQITNGTVYVAPFQIGTTGPVVVTATKTDQNKVTVWSFDVTDVAGNTRHCA
jgi:hypothetical protein